MDKLNLLIIFRCVAESGNFASAANQLSLSPSAVSKAIARLENDIGCKLFHRSTRKIALTAGGQSYYDTAVQVIDNLNDCEAELKENNESPAGVLKLNLPVSYGRLYVVPLLQKFSARYPLIHLEISFDDNYSDTIHGRYDISIRSGTLEDKNLFFKKLSPMDFLICGAANTEHSKPTIMTNERLLQQRWIRFRFKQTGRVMPITLMTENGPKPFDPTNNIIVDDGEALAELCAAGLGVTLVSSLKRDNNI